MDYQATMWQDKELRGTEKMEEMETIWRKRESQYGYEHMDVIWIINEVPVIQTLS